MTSCTSIDWLTSCSYTFSSPMIVSFMVCLVCDRQCPRLRVDQLDIVISAPPVGFILVDLHRTAKPTFSVISLGRLITMYYKSSLIPLLDNISFPLFTPIFSRAWPACPLITTRRVLATETTLRLVDILESYSPNRYF